MINSYANAVSSIHTDGTSTGVKTGVNTGVITIETEEIYDFNTQVSSDSIINMLHRLYLQNIDHPGLLLISKKLYLQKNKLGIIDGSYMRPIDLSPLKSQ